MRRTFTVSLATLATAVATIAVTAPAQAHGYISSPPSRQALCAAGTVKDCGPIQFEPQSVEAPKGSKLCSGGNSTFSVLDDNSRDWPATRVASSSSFSWTLTARHRTSTWQYSIGNTQLAEFNDGGRQPNATVSHTVNFGNFRGRQTVLAVWNIADTPMAFYACIDVEIGGGGSTPPAPTTPAAPTTPTAPATVAPTTAAPSAPAPTAPGGVGTWKPLTWYERGSRVTFDGVLYECRQSHTTLPGWEPPIVLALWLPL